MKVNINGRNYDTSTAVQIGFDGRSAGLFCEGWRETLFVKRNGEYFLFRSGGGPTEIINRAYGFDPYGADQVIIPLTRLEAMGWAKEHVNASDYERAFGHAEKRRIPPDTYIVRHNPKFERDDGTMRAIIIGKNYDTRTATRVGSASAVDEDGLCYWIETLYVKRTGEYFVLSECGPTHIDGRACGYHPYLLGYVIIPLTQLEAMGWAKEHMNAADYERIFGPAAE